MRKYFLSTSSLINASILTAALCTANISNAQDIENFYSPNVEISTRGSKKRNIHEFDYLQPIWGNNNQLSLVDLKLKLDNKRSKEVNLGLVYRHNVDENFIIGAYGYFDHRQTSEKFKVSGVTLGAELLSKYIDARVNFYKPFKGKKKVQHNNKKRIEIQGTTIFAVSGAHNYEYAFSGYDVEIGAPVFGFSDEWNEKIGTRLYVAKYDFSHKDLKHISGIRFRIEQPLGSINIGDNGLYFNINAETQHDKVRKRQTFVGISAKLDFGDKKKKSKGQLQSRMMDTVIRDVDIVTTTQRTAEERNHFMLDGREVKKIYYVGAANAGYQGEGTSSNPFSIEQLKKLNIDDAIVVVSNITPEKGGKEIAASEYKELKKLPQVVNEKQDLKLVSTGADKAVITINSDSKGKPVFAVVDVVNTAVVVDSKVITPVTTTNIQQATQAIVSLIPEEKALVKQEVIEQARAEEKIEQDNQQAQEENNKRLQQQEQEKIQQEEQNRVEREREEEERIVPQEQPAEEVRGEPVPVVEEVIVAPVVQARVPQEQQPDQPAEEVIVAPAPVVEAEEVRGEPAPVVEEVRGEPVVQARVPQEQQPNQPAEEVRGERAPVVEAEEVRGEPVVQARVPQEQQPNQPAEEVRGERAPVVEAEEVRGEPVVQARVPQEQQPNQPAEEVRGEPAPVVEEVIVAPVPVQARVPQEQQPDQPAEEVIVAPAPVQARNEEQNPRVVAAEVFDWDAIEGNEEEEENEEEEGQRVIAMEEIRRREAIRYRGVLNELIDNLSTQINNIALEDRLRIQVIANEVIAGNLNIHQLQNRLEELAKLDPAKNAGQEVLGEVLDNVTAIVNGPVITIPRVQAILTENEQAAIDARRAAAEELEDLEDGTVDSGVDSNRLSDLDKEMYDLIARIPEMFISNPNDHLNNLGVIRDRDYKNAQIIVRENVDKTKAAIEDIIEEKFINEDAKAQIRLKRTEWHQKTQARLELLRNNGDEMRAQRAREMGVEPAEVDQLVQEEANNIEVKLNELVRDIKNIIANNANPEHLATINRYKSYLKGLMFDGTVATADIRNGAQGGIGFHHNNSSDITGIDSIHKLNSRFDGELPDIEHGIDVLTDIVINTIKVKVPNTNHLNKNAIVDLATRAENVAPSEQYKTEAQKTVNQEINIDIINEEVQKSHSAVNVWLAALRSIKKFTTAELDKATFTEEITGRWNTAETAIYILRALTEVSEIKRGLNKELINTEDHTNPNNYPDLQREKFSSNKVFQVQKENLYGLVDLLGQSQRTYNKEPYHENYREGIIDFAGLVGGTQLKDSSSCPHGMCMRIISAANNKHPNVVVKSNTPGEFAQEFAGAIVREGFAQRNPQDNLFNVEQQNEIRNFHNNLNTLIDENKATVKVQIDQNTKSVKLNIVKTDPEADINIEIPRAYKEKLKTVIQDLSYRYDIFHPQYKMKLVKPTGHPLSAQTMLEETMKEMPIPMIRN